MSSKLFIPVCGGPVKTIPINPMGVGGGVEGSGRNCGWWGFADNLILGVVVGTVNLVSWVVGVKTVPSKTTPPDFFFWNSPNH